MKKLNQYSLFFLMLLALPIWGFGQKKIEIDSCFVWSESHYPEVAKYALLDQSKAYTVENASTGYLPRVSINGQASYQSDVTHLPIDVPNVVIEPLSPRQYNVYGEVYQPLTGMIGIGSEKALAANNADMEKQSVAIEVYHLKERIIDIYFGILMMDAQLVDIGLVELDIDAGIRMVDASITNGTALRSAKDELLAQKISLAQRKIQIQSDRKAYLHMLGLFVNRDFAEADIELVRPSQKALTASINRPELALFDLQNRGLEIQNQLISEKNIPELGLFFKGGYGRPGLNFLSNDFEMYYIGGAKLSWNISRFYTTKNQREILEVRKEISGAERATFLFNTQMATTSQLLELEKYDKLIANDEVLIEIRERIKSTSARQLEFGSITSTDFLIHINAAEQSRQNLILHALQRLKTVYKYGITTGNN